MTDDKVVQPDATLKGEALPEMKPLEGGEPQPQSLEEQVKQLISGLAEQTDLSKRELQSFKDKALKEIGEAQARAQFAEESLAGVEAGFKETDPEAAEMARLRTSDAQHRRMGVAQIQRQQAEVFDKSFQENMNQFITGMGIDPEDKRLDWAPEDRSYLSKQQRILASVSKIQKENQKVTEEKLTQQQVDFEAKIRKDLGLDSEDTSISPGVGVDFQKLSAEDKIKAGLKEPKKRK